MSRHGDELWVGGQRMLFFHAHGFVPRGPGQPRVLNLERYHVTETPLLRQSIFEPYESALIAAATEMAVPLVLAMTSERSGESTETRKAIHALRGQLAAHDAAHMDVVDALQGRLDANEVEIAGLRTDVLDARARVGALERSRSWRWTGAARRVAGWLGK
jgi:hypothetical protein